VGSAFFKRAFLANPSLSVPIIEYLIGAVKYWFALHAVRAKPRVLGSFFLCQHD
jgi:hypothetical protein